MAAQSLLEEALEASGVAYWSYDTETQEIFFSDRYYTMLGYQIGEVPMSFDGWRSLLHPDEAADVMESFRRFIERETGTFEIEYRLKTASENWRWVQSRARVMEHLSSGLPKRVSGTNIEITQQKVMERALRESEARWTSLVDEAPLGVFLVGRDGTILFANRHEAASKPTTVLGRNWKDFLPTNLHDQIDALLEESFRAGTPRVFATHQDEDGGRRHYENHSSPVREETTVTALMVISIDVTDRIRTERRRARIAQRMETLLELHNQNPAQHDAILTSVRRSTMAITESQLGFITFSAATQTGTPLPAWWSDSEKLGGALARLVDELVAQRKPLVLNDWDLEGCPFHRLILVPLFQKDDLGAVIGVGNKPTPYDDDDVADLQVLAESFWQLRRRREAEQLVNRLYQAVEHSPVALVISTPRGIIEYTNPRYHTMKGIPLGTALGTQVFQQNLNQLSTEGYLELWATILSGKSWQGELTDERPDGTPYPQWVSVSPVVDDLGAVTNLIVVLEDISERKETQALLFRAQKMETVGQLAAGVAHDFNNLLTAVLGYNTMVLRKSEPDSAVHSYAERIEVAGRKAAELVTGLLAVGRQQRLKKTDLDLRQLLRDDDPLLRTMVKGSIELRVDLDGPALMVEADPGQISQVVLNLVSNASDALEGQGTISIHTGLVTDGEEWAWFSVRDDGPGIPPEHQEKIFEPFFTTKPVGKGTGLGLAMAHGIVQQHRGRMKMESSAKTGTCFTVFLPLVPGETTSAPGLIDQ